MSQKLVVLCFWFFLVCKLRKEIEILVVFDFKKGDSEIDSESNSDLNLSSLFRDNTCWCFCVAIL